jgi:hypothetical protein
MTEGIGNTEKINPKFRNILAVMYHISLKHSTWLMDKDTLFNHLGFLDKVAAINLDIFVDVNTAIHTFITTGHLT